MRGFVLDTSAVNRICDGAADVMRWWPAFLLDVVLSELAADPNALHRQALLETVLGKVQIVRAEQPEFAYARGIPTDDPDCSANYHPAHPLGRQLPNITRAIGGKFEKHWRDAFIVQAALRHGFTLVTADRNQARAARRFSVSVDFIRPAADDAPR